MTADLLRLVRDYPLAWLISTEGTQLRTTVVPLLAETDTAGAPASLLGHLPLANPHVDALRANPRGIVLFQGPHAYISPHLVSKADWAPTWNFTVARFDVEVAFVPDETEFALKALARHLERDRDDPWTIEKMGARYKDLAAKVVGFRAHIQSATPRFKHGQDETPQTFDEIVNGLDDRLLAEWMTRTVRGDQLPKP